MVLGNAVDLFVLELAEGIHDMVSIVSFQVMKKYTYFLSESKV